MARKTKTDTVVGGIPASAYNMDAVLAAQAILDAGGSMQQATKAARDIVMAARKGGKPAPVAKEETPLDAAALHRYLTAACRLRSGQFDGLSVAELADALKTSPIPARPFVQEEWQ